MKRNTIIKLLLDVTMIILYLLLMFADGLGGFFHETVGIGIGIIFLIHVLMNRAMLRGLFVNAKSKEEKSKDSKRRNAKSKSRKKYLQLVLDIILMICMPIVIITGILIAKELFVIHADISWTLLFDIHNILSYVCLGIMILHTLLHAKYLFGVIKKIPSSMSGKEMRAAICRFGVGTVIAVIAYFALAIHKNLHEKQDNLNVNGLQHDKSEISGYDSEITSHEDESQTLSESASHEDESQTALEKDKTQSLEESGDNSVLTENETTPPPPTLEEYLSKLRCTGCGRECLLSNPRCRKGENQASQAEEEYYQIYAIQEND